MTDAQVGIIVALVLGALLIIALLPRRSTPDVASRLDEFGRRLSVLTEHQSKQDEKIAETNHSVAQLRQIVTGLPTKDEVHKIELEVREMKGNVASIDRATAATQRMVESIDRFIRKEPT